MKTLFFVFILILPSMCFSGSGNGTNGLAPAQTDLTKILKLQSEIKNYYEVFFLVEYYSSKKIDISSYYVDARDLDKSDPNISSDLIFSISPNVTSKESSNFTSETAPMNNFQFTSLSIKKLEVHKSKVEIFTYLDSQNKKSLVRWFNETDGFELRTDFYDDKGNLKISQFHEELSKASKFREHSNENTDFAYKNFEDIFSQKHFDVENFCLDILTQFYDGKIPFVFDEHE